MNLQKLSIMCILMNHINYDKIIKRKIKIRIYMYKYLKTHHLSLNQKMNNIILRFTFYRANEGGGIKQDKVEKIFKKYLDEEFEIENKYVGYLITFKTNKTNENIFSLVSDFLGELSIINFVEDAEIEINKKIFTMNEDFEYEEKFAPNAKLTKL